MGQCGPIPMADPIIGATLISIHLTYSGEDTDMLTSHCGVGPTVLDAVRLCQKIDWGTIGF